MGRATLHTQERIRACRFQLGSTLAIQQHFVSGGRGGRQASTGDWDVGDFAIVFAIVIRNAYNYNAGGGSGRGGRGTIISYHPSSAETLSVPAAGSRSDKILQACRVVGDPGGRLRTVLLFITVMHPHI